MLFARAGTGPIPIWLAVTYLASNLILNALNIHWFAKMIATVKKRFEGPDATPKESEAEAEEKMDGAVGRRKREDSVVLEVANGLEEDDFIGHPTSGAEVGKGGPEGELRKRN